jgi:outer membrane lipoprotein carrier protein
LITHAGLHTTWRTACRVALVSLLGSACISAASTPPTARTALDRFLDGLTTWDARFEQTLSDARGRELEAVAGRLAISRPGRFRWEISPRPANAAASRAGGATAPAGATQVMVADGRNVWFYDRELEQVTVKPSAGALTATPAMLLAGTVDVRREFSIDAAPAADGLQWVRVRPRRLDAEFREARLGFDPSGLRRMELEDKLGQTARVRFSEARRNVAIAGDAFRFVPPAGVDVIGKPAS